MFILGYFIAAVARIVDIALTIYMWIIIAQAVLSWVNPDPYNPIVRFLYRATEPALAFVRRRLPVHGLGMDFSPVIILLVIYFLQSFLVPTLMRFSFYFR